MHSSIRSIGIARERRRFRRAESRSAPDLAGVEPGGAQQARWAHVTQRGGEKMSWGLGPGSWGLGPSHPPGRLPGGSVRGCQWQWGHRGVGELEVGSRIDILTRIEQEKHGIGVFPDCEFPRWLPDYGRYKCRKVGRLRRIFGRYQKWYNTRESGLPSIRHLEAESLSEGGWQAWIAEARESSVRTLKHCASVGRLVCLSLGVWGMACGSSEPRLFAGRSG